MEWSEEQGVARRTYAHLLERALRIGSGLRSYHGLSPGDKVFVLVENGIELLEIVLACGLYEFVVVLLEFDNGAGSTGLAGKKADLDGSSKFEATVEDWRNVFMWSG